MWKKVWDFVEKHHMLRQGDRVVVGVSGGADSVCLLAVLAENRLDLKLRAMAFGERRRITTQHLSVICAGNGGYLSS